MRALRVTAELTSSEGSTLNRQRCNALEVALSIAALPLLWAIVARVTAPDALSTSSVMLVVPWGTLSVLGRTNG